PEPQPGEVCRHPPSRLVGRGPRQLLERQSRLRSRRRRPRRQCLQAERPRGPCAVDGPAGQASRQQPGGAGDPLGAEPVAGPVARMRSGHPTADGSALARKAAAMTETVTVSHAVKTYREVEALRDVSLSLSGGEVVALVGHNGARKTTLIELMLGLIRPTSG